MNEPFFGVSDSDENGIVRESILHATNDFYIQELVGPATRMERFSGWLNGWLPGRIRLGQVNDRWRFFRV